VFAKVEETEFSGRPCSASGILHTLGISTSGYYAKLNHVPSNQEIKKKEVMSKIIDIFSESREIYGAPKITLELNKLGYNAVQKTVSNYMREMGMRAVWVKKYRNHSTKRVHEKLHNILKQQFSPIKPNTVWCTDITYIWTTEGFVYLTSIMDLYSRKIIAWRVT